MSRRIDGRGVTLTLLFVLWLSVQSCVIALSPSWGFVLPHEHITRGVLSERAWQEHLREHQFAALRYYEADCETPSVTSDVMASLPDSSGVLSFFTSTIAALQDTQIEFPTHMPPCVNIVTSNFFALDLFYSPLEPPPNL